MARWMRCIASTNSALSSEPRWRVSASCQTRARSSSGNRDLTKMSRALSPAYRYKVSSLVLCGTLAAARPPMTPSCARTVEQAIVGLRVRKQALEPRAVVGRYLRHLTAPLSSRCGDCSLATRSVLPFHHHPLSECYLSCCIGRIAVYIGSECALSCRHRQTCSNLAVTSASN